MTSKAKKVSWNAIGSVKFSSLDELDRWFSGPLPVVDKLRIPRDLSTQRTRLTDKTDLKLLVCHDFMGGYNEDDCPVGYFPHPSGTHYFLQYPTLVDTFVYFSHHRVTVPPVCWVNMLHQQGIPCLGTLIFEGKDNDDLDKIVSRDSSGDFTYVKHLVALAQHYKFDGWLINVETTFTKPSLSSEILLFTETLRSEMHMKVGNSQVIWYDAFISSKNKVFYQNGVNELNYPHFDSSDYFFTNYWWDENKLKSNVLNIGLQGVKRKTFVGIDVWGRGTKVGKGGFDTGLAINFLRIYSSNVGLFAPAWTYENFETDEFISIDHKFWIGEMTDSYPSGSVGTYISHYTTPVIPNDSGFSFYTNFSQGQGDSFNVMGETVFDEHWVNMSLQMSNPSKLDGDVLSITKSDSYIGGSSLKVNHKSSAEPKFNSDGGTKLFNFKSDIKSNELNISVTFKQLSKTIADYFFQLEVEYYIERRYRNTTRVKDGKFKIPLKTVSSSKWEKIEAKFAIPTLQAHEHFVLEGCSLNWVNSMESDTVDIEKSWIMINNEAEPNVTKSILIGDLLIETHKLEDISHVIKSVKRQIIKDDQVFIEWVNDNEVLMWLVYENGKFQRPFTTPCFITNRMDKIRVDCLLRNGELVKGMDIFV